MFMIERALSMLRSIAVIGARLMIGLIGASAALPALADDAIATPFSADGLLSTETASVPGVSQKAFNLPAADFNFTALVDDTLTVWIADSAPDEGKAIAAVYFPETRDEFSCQIYHYKTDSFVEAKSAGRAFLAINGYQEVLENEQASNNAFALMAGLTSDGGGGYQSLARIAAISGGSEFVILYCRLKPDTYTKYEHTVARLFGTLKLANPPDFSGSFEAQSYADKTNFLVPRGWTLSQKPTSSVRGTNFTLVLEREYPNISLSVREEGFERTKSLAEGMISSFYAGIKANANARLIDEPGGREIQKQGEVTGFLFAHAWDLADSDIPMISQFLIQKNLGETLGAISINTLDIRRAREKFDPSEYQEAMEAWATSMSAFSVASLSMKEGPEAFRRTLDVRALGH
jgi:hypothetical protein